MRVSPKVSPGLLKLAFWVISGQEVEMDFFPTFFNLT
jgi:hypothetical protein